MEKQELAHLTIPLLTREQALPMPSWRARSETKCPSLELPHDQRGCYV